MSVAALPPLRIPPPSSKLSQSETTCESLPSPVIDTACAFHECRTRVAVGPDEPLLLADRYLLLEHVDTGTYGTVSIHRKCVDTETGEEFVCRQFLASTGGSLTLLEAYQRLADSVYVTPIRECVQSKDMQGRSTLYFLCPKSHGDLHSYLRSRKRLRESEARSLFRQVAQTVQECHSRGVVLTDLRLRRFVFSDAQRTRVRLESLEEAVILDPSSEDDLMCRKQGYPAYVTPEIIIGRGGKCSGRATDMWALGVILYTLLVGRYPFQDYSPLTLFTKILRGSFTVPDFVSSRAKCLIRGLLCRDPKKRLAANDVLKHPWFSAVLRCDRNDKIDSKETTIRSSASRKTSRNRIDDQVVPQDLHEMMSV